MKDLIRKYRSTLLAGEHFMLDGFEVLSKKDGSLVIKKDEKVVVRAEQVEILMYEDNPELRDFLNVTDTGTSLVTKMLFRIFSLAPKWSRSYYDYSRNGFSSEKDYLVINEDFCIFMNYKCAFDVIQKKGMVLYTPQGSQMVVTGNNRILPHFGVINLERVEEGIADVLKRKIEIVRHATLELQSCIDSLLLGSRYKKYFGNMYVGSRIIKYEAHKGVLCFLTDSGERKEVTLKGVWNRDAAAAAALSYGTWYPDYWYLVAFKKVLLNYVDPAFNVLILEAVKRGITDPYLLAGDLKIENRQITIDGLKVASITKKEVKWFKRYGPLGTDTKAREDLEKKLKNIRDIEDTKALAARYQELILLVGFAGIRGFLSTMSDTSRERIITAGTSLEVILEEATLVKIGTKIYVNPLCADQAKERLGKIVVRLMQIRLEECVHKLSTKYIKVGKYPMGKDYNLVIEQGSISVRKKATELYAKREGEYFWRMEQVADLKMFDEAHEVFEKYLKALVPLSTAQRLVLDLMAHTEIGDAPMVLRHGFVLYKQKNALHIARDKVVIVSQGINGITVLTEVDWKVLAECMQEAKHERSIGN